MVPIRSLALVTVLLIAHSASKMLKSTMSVRLQGKLNPRRRHHLSHDWNAIRCKL